MHMSTKSDQFEIDLTEAINSFQNKRMPSTLPEWLVNLGVVPGAEIISARRVGAVGSKTDIFVSISNSTSLKISAKLSSADYFGNWYSHTRVLNEFGENAFDLLTTDCTNWANRWKSNQNASIFVGVSVCFGKRTGGTAREFTEIFEYANIKKIVAGDGCGDTVANCLYVSSRLPCSIDELVQDIQPINEEVIRQLSSNFKVIYRPINPETEGSNRGKCVYTEFVPYKKLDSKTRISNLSQLITLGEYKEVTRNSLNHNHILNTLELEFNIVIDRKAT